MTITRDDVDQAIGKLESWKKRAKLNRQKQAEKDCEQLLRVVRGLAGK